MEIFDYSQAGKRQKMNGHTNANGMPSVDQSAEMLGAIRELTRENDRLTTELGAAQESLDLFERYRSMAQEYMNMCICSSRDYLNGQFKQCEQDYEQLSRKGLHTSSSSSSSTSKCQNTINSISNNITNLSSSSSSSGFSLNIVPQNNPSVNGLTIEIRSGHESGKSKIRAYLDSLQSKGRSNQPEMVAQLSDNHQNFVPNPRISKRLFASPSNGESLIRAQPKSRKIDTVNDESFKQFQQLLANRFLPQNSYNALNNLNSMNSFMEDNNFIMNNAAMDDSDDDDDDDVDEINMDSPPPPLLNRRLMFGQEHKGDSILGAMLENGCKPYQANYRNKNSFSSSPVPSLSIMKFDENNNSKRTHLSYEDRTSIIARLKQHEPGAKIAREYGITKQAVSAIKRRANIVVNDLSDVSLILKKSASSSPEVGSIPQKKFTRKFPKEMNVLCRPVNPLEMLKNQRKASDDHNGSGQNRSFNNLNEYEKLLQYKGQRSNGKGQQMSDTNVSSLLLSKLLKGECDGGDLYDQKPKSLLVSNQNSVAKGFSSIISEGHSQSRNQLQSSSDDEEQSIGKLMNHQSSSDNYNDDDSSQIEHPNDEQAMDDGEDDQGLAVDEEEDKNQEEKEDDQEKEVNGEEGEEHEDEEGQEEGQEVEEKQEQEEREMNEEEDGQTAEEDGETQELESDEQEGNRKRLASSVSSNDLISSPGSSEVFDSSSNHYNNDLSSPAVSADHSL